MCIYDYRTPHTDTHTQIYIYIYCHVRMFNQCLSAIVPSAPGQPSTSCHEHGIAWWALGGCTAGLAPRDGPPGEKTLAGQARRSSVQQASGTSITMRKKTWLSSQKTKECAWIGVCAYIYIYIYIYIHTHTDIYIYIRSCWIIKSFKSWKLNAWVLIWICGLVGSWCLATARTPILSLMTGLMKRWNTRCGWTTQIGCTTGMESMGWNKLARSEWLQHTFASIMKIQWCLAPCVDPVKWHPPCWPHQQPSRCDGMISQAPRLRIPGHQVAPSRHPRRCWGLLAAHLSSRCLQSIRRGHVHHTSQRRRTWTKHAPASGEFDMRAPRLCFFAASKRYHTCTESQLYQKKCFGAELASLAMCASRVATDSSLEISSLCSASKRQEPRAICRCGFDVCMGEIPWTLHLRWSRRVLF